MARKSGGLRLLSVAPARAGDRVVITSRTAVGVRRAISELRAEVFFLVQCQKVSHLRICTQIKTVCFLEPALE